MDCYGLDTEYRVHFYEQDFYVLSNFSSFKVGIDGILFDTAEHAYHYFKFDHEEYEGNITENNLSVIRNEIRFARSAHDAFKIAHKHKDFVSKHWVNSRVSYMQWIIRLKTEQHEYVRRKLLMTGTRELVENSWRDDFWGWGPYKDGQNMLGKLWMILREKLRNEEAIKNIAKLAEEPPLTPEQHRHAQFMGGINDEEWD